MTKKGQARYALALFLPQEISIGFSAKPTIRQFPARPVSRYCLSISPFNNACSI